MATYPREERKKRFLERLKKLYPDYELVSEYVDGGTFIVLQHKDGYLWKTKPRYLDGKRQCPEVALKNRTSKKKKYKYTKEEFEKLFYIKWNNEYILNKDSFTKMDSTIEVTHKLCGRKFYPLAKNMMYVNKKGCTHCYSKRRKTMEEFKQEVYNLVGDEYTVLDDEYKTTHTKYRFRHNSEFCDYHEFEMCANDFITKHSQRCPKCAELRKESYGSKLFKEKLNENIS